jgi:hypothetical protein
MSKYPAIPEPQLTLESLRESVLSLKEMVENIVGTRGPADTTLASATQVDQQLVALDVSLREAISQAVSGAGSVTDVTATAPLASTGGATPDISLSGPVSAAQGGTGRDTLTVNSLLAGDGVDPVALIAPGASGNVLTSNGTAWASAAPPPPAWTLLVKSSDQAITSNATTPVVVTGLEVPMAANKNYLMRGVVIAHHSSGGVVIRFNGPGTPTQANATAYTSTYTLNSISGLYLSQIFGTSLTASQSWMIPINFMIRNGSTAGDLVLEFRQNSSSANPTTIRAGSWIEWTEVA